MEMAEPCGSLAQEPAERDAERPGQRDQRGDGGLPITGLESGEMGGGELRLLGQLLEGQAGPHPLFVQALRDGRQDRIELHGPSLERSCLRGKSICHSSRGGNNGETPLTRAAVGRLSGCRAASPGGADGHRRYSRSTRSPLLTRAATSPAKRVHTRSRAVASAASAPGVAARIAAAPPGTAAVSGREGVEEAVDRFRRDLEVELHAPRHVADAEGLVGVAARC